VKVTPPFIVTLMWKKASRAILLWLLGAPIPIIIQLALLQNRCRTSFTSRRCTERNEVMTKQHPAHEYLTWAKQKLDEIDSTLATLDSSVGALEKDARTQADRAITRIRTARDAFKAKVDAAVRSDFAAAEAITKEAQVGIEAGWTEVELAFQDFLAATASHASIVKNALAARAEAQRQAWQSSLQAARATATEVVDQARGEADTVIRRLSAEAQKAEATLGQVSVAGDESWKAIKVGLEEAISIYDRTWKKISDAIAKI
jgi:hypothetical protein